MSEDYYVTDDYHKILITSTFMNINKDNFQLHHVILFMFCYTKTFLFILAPIQGKL